MIVDSRNITLRLIFLNLIVLWYFKVRPVATLLELLNGRILLTMLITKVRSTPQPLRTIKDP